MIKKREVTFPDPERYKIYMSAECKDFISRLLNKDPAQRLGTKGGISEVLSHPWLKGIDNKALLSKKIPATYKPTVSKDPFDVSNFDKEFTDEENAITMLNTGEMKKVTAAASDFKDF
jgi:serum/glucocorticoid-regulated kinase 2